MPITKHALKRLRERYQRNYSQEDEDKLIQMCIELAPTGYPGKHRTKRFPVIFKGVMIKVVFDPITETIVTVFPFNDVEPKIKK